MLTRFVVNYYILPIDSNASARQNVVITTFCNVTTFWVATSQYFVYINGINALFENVQVFALITEENITLVQVFIENPSYFLSLEMQLLWQS